MAWDLEGEGAEGEGLYYAEEVGGGCCAGAISSVLNVSAGVDALEPPKHQLSVRHAVTKVISDSVTVKKLAAGREAGLFCPYKVDPVVGVLASFLTTGGL